MTNELSKELITSALELCGKSMEDMNINPILCKFHMPNFYAYLLSPEFIEKYSIYLNSYSKVAYQGPLYKHTAKIIGKSIYEYQSGNERPLIDLLSKI